MIKTTKYIAASVIAAVFVGCTSVDDEPWLEPSAEDYITFAPPTISVNASIGDFTGAPTSRAGLATSIDQFKVWGFCVPKNISGAPNAANVGAAWAEKSQFFFASNGVNAADVFNGETVTVDGAFATYRGADPGRLEPWNENEAATYGFIAGAPINNMTMADGSASQDAAHGPRLTFSYTPTSDYTAQPDALIAANLTHTGRSRVSLNFTHIMAGLRFKFANYTKSDDPDVEPDPSETNLIITGVTFSGDLYTSATYDFTTTTPVQTVSGSIHRTFTLFAGEQTISSETSDFLSPNDPVTLLLLPNPKASTHEEILAANKEITITYKIGNNGEQKTFHLNEFGFIPKAGSIHTATFSFVGNKFVVNFQMGNSWENGSDNNVTIH